jgi:hypothetical protein
LGRTQLTTRELGANSVNKDDIDTTTTTKALFTKAIAGNGISLSSTGVDAGTGDVTITPALPLNTQTASYTLVLTDAWKDVQMNVATANNLTVPLNSSVAFVAEKTQILISQIGAGQTTVVATGGVTINSAPGTTLKLRGQYSQVVLEKTGTDTWYLSGDLEFTDNVKYKTILSSTGSHIATKVAGTYGMGVGNPLAVSGTGILYPLDVIYIVSTDFTTGAQFRISAQVMVNDVAPTGNYTFGLYPITRPGTSGGAGLNIYTLGTVVSGSTVLFTTPAADSMNQGTSSDFTIPADAYYVIGVITTATVATSSLLHMIAKLQVR